MVVGVKNPSVHYCQSAIWKPPCCSKYVLETIFCGIKIATASPNYSTVMIEVAVVVIEAFKGQIIWIVIIERFCNQQFKLLTPTMWQHS